MNKVNFTGLVLVAAMFFSYNNKSAFTIIGTIENVSKAKTVYLQQADSVAFKTIDSTSISADGKFQFKQSSPYACLFKIIIDTVSFDVIAQNGDEIEIKTDFGNNSQGYIVSGSQASVDLKTFYEFSNAYKDENNKLEAEFDAKSQKSGVQNDSLFKEYLPIFQKNLSVYSKKVINFGKEHKNTLAGFYAIKGLDGTKFENVLVAYADDLKGDITNNPAVHQFIAAMAKARPLSVGHKAPNFILNNSGSKPVKLTDFQGKYVLLDFWASWCVPCRQENPNLLKQYAAFKNKGLNILGISLDTDKGAWLKAVAKDHLSWQQASELKGFQGATEILYQIEAIPSNFIIDQQGFIIAKNLRGTELEDFLKQTLN